MIDYLEQTRSLTRAEDLEFSSHIRQGEAIDSKVYSVFAFILEQPNQAGQLKKNVSRITFHPQNPQSSKMFPFFVLEVSSSAKTLTWTLHSNATGMHRDSSDRGTFSTERRKNVFPWSRMTFSSTTRQCRQAKCPTVLLTVPPCREQNVRSAVERKWCGGLSLGHCASSFRRYQIKVRLVTFPRRTRIS